jgi:hypothetical protein
VPFDATGLRQPKVTVQPPSLVRTERGSGGDPRRVHIEIVVHLPAPPQRRRGGILWWLLAFLLIALAAHAQPHEWRAYPFGSGWNYYGTDAQGHEWTGHSFTNGGTEYFDATGPDGRHQHCESYPFGSGTTSRCQPDRQ